MSLNRSKTSDRIAEIMIMRIVRGELTAGERIDLDGLAAELDVSRSPVREAMILLERDGLVEMPFHRGVFVSTVNVDTVTEGFKLYALLSAFAAHRAARGLDDEQRDHLIKVHQMAQVAKTSDQYADRARVVRRVINTATTGPHLRSLMRTFNGLVRTVSSLAVETGLDREKELLAAEVAAVTDGNRRAAAETAVRHIMDTGRRSVAEMVRRELLPAEAEVDLELTDDDHIAALTNVVMVMEGSHG